MGTGSKTRLGFARMACAERSRLSVGLPAGRRALHPWTGRQKLRHGLLIRRAGEEISLCLFAIQLQQLFHMRFGFGAFRNHFQARFWASMMITRTISRIFRIRVHVQDEDPVDLQRVHRNPAQAAQGRVSRAEIVDAQTHAQSLQLGQHFTGFSGSPMAMVSTISNRRQLGSMPGLLQWSSRSRLARFGMGKLL